MGYRNACVAGLFYPGKEEEIKRFVEEKIKEVDAEEGAGIVVSPHAGWIYCGKTMAYSFKALRKSFTRAILIGPSHYSVGTFSLSSSTWLFPGFEVEVDKEAVSSLSREIFEVNEVAHLNEHCLEVLVPWLKYVARNEFKIVPVLINPLFFDDVNELRKCARELCRIVDSDTVVVVSSDFTHYGTYYSYTPFPFSEEKIREYDMEVIELIKKLDTEELLNVCKSRTVCGYGAIAVGMEIARRKGFKKVELLHYSTSFSVSKTPDAVVGYASIAFY